MADVPATALADGGQVAWDNEAAAAVLTEGQMIVPDPFFLSTTATTAMATAAVTTLADDSVQDGESPSPPSSSASFKNEEITAIVGGREVAVSRDPIDFLIREIRAMDVNAAINTSILLLVTVIVLSKMAMIDAGMTRGWTPAELAVRVPLDDWKSYTSALREHPIGVKAATSATVYGIGDLIAQRTEGVDISRIDRARVVRSVLAGLIGHGPLSHVWYEKSDQLFTCVLHWTGWWSTFPKIALDRPIWNNCYILLLGAMKMQRPSLIWADMKRTTIPLLLSGLKLWPLAHCVTYGLIPVENRLLWVDMVEIVWVTILATQAAGGGEAASSNDNNNNVNVNVKAIADNDGGKSPRQGDHCH